MKISIPIQVCIKYLNRFSRFCHFKLESEVDWLTNTIHSECDFRCQWTCIGTNCLDYLQYIIKATSLIYFLLTQLIIRIIRWIGTNEYRNCALFCIFSIFSDSHSVCQLWSHLLMWIHWLRMSYMLGPLPLNCLSSDLLKVRGTLCLLRKASERRSVTENEIQATVHK